MSSNSSDRFYNGRLIIHQPEGGYRFSIDAVILAHSITVKKGDRILDVGTGCGIIPLLLAYNHENITITGVEIQSDLADLATKNIKENHFTDRVTIICRDARKLTRKETSGPFNLIICNPPHYPVDSGRINPDAGRALARHEITLNTGDIIETAARLLDLGGRIGIIYPAHRLAELFEAMKSRGIEPKRTLCVHPMPGKEAKRVVVEGVKGGKPGLRVAPPLFIHTQQGEYSHEVEQMISGNREPPAGNPE